MKFGMLVEVDKWCMTVCSMTQSKVKITSPWKSEICHFQKSSPPQFIMGAGKWPRILKLGLNTSSLSGPDFLFLCYFLCHMTLKLAISSCPHKKFLRFQWNSVCRYRSMNDAWWYAVWPDLRSRSRALESRKFGHIQRLSSPPFKKGAGKWPWILQLGHNT